MSGNDIFAFMFAMGILVLFIIVFIFLLRRIRRRGSSVMTMVSFGANDPLMGKDEKHAVEMIVDLNAHKKMEEQSDSDPLHKNKK